MIKEIYPQTGWAPEVQVAFTKLKTYVLAALSALTDRAAARAPASSSEDLQHPTAEDEDVVELVPTKIAADEALVMVNNKEADTFVGAAVEAGIFQERHVNCTHGLPTIEESPDEHEQESTSTPMGSQAAVWRIAAAAGAIVGVTLMVGLAVYKRRRDAACADVENRRTTQTSEASRRLHVLKKRMQEMLNAQLAFH